MATVSPCLWFDGKAEEAARFYVSLLPGSRIETVVPYSLDMPGGKAGEVMAVEFTLGGERFLALNGGPHFQFSPAVSFFIHCAGQAELDSVWERLLDGGTPMQCGWITDRYGMTWQVVPAALGTMMKDPDPARIRRLTEAMMPMVKLDLAALERAFRGEG